MVSNDSVMIQKTFSQLNVTLHEMAAIAFADFYDHINWIFKVTFVFRSWIRNHIVFWVKLPLNEISLKKTL